MQIKLLTATVNGKKVAFSSETEFLVQVSIGRGSKSSYKTRGRFKGSEFAEMAEHFQTIPFGNGKRKRIVMHGKVLIRCR